MKKSLFEKKGEILQLCSVHLSRTDKVILQTFFFFFFYPSSSYTSDGALERSEAHGDGLGDASMGLAGADLCLSGPTALSATKKGSVVPN